MITLRPLAISDLDTMTSLVQNQDVALFIPGMITDRDGTEKWIRNLSDHDHEFVVMLGEEIIGECSLMENGDGSGEIGIMLFPEYWRKGYGMAVIRQLTMLAEKLNVKTLIATTSRMNKPCIGLLQKVGFKKCAVGWMISEEKIDVPEPFKELFGTVMFEKELTANP